MKIETLFLDIGGVILDPDKRFWDRLETEHGVASGAEELFYGEEGPWHACKTGQITYDDYVTKMAVQLGLERRLLAELRAELEWVVIDPMVEWVRKVKAHHKPLIIALSNADTTLEERLVTLRLEDLFDHVINSARVGLAKPDPEIYRLAMTYTPSLPSACLFVDDRERNMPAPQELGMHTVVYRGFEDFSQAVHPYFAFD